MQNDPILEDSQAVRVNINSNTPAEKDASAKARENSEG